MVSGRNAAIIHCKVDVCGGENQFPKVMSELKRPIYGNTLIVEDDILL